MVFLQLKSSTPFPNILSSTSKNQCYLDTTVGNQPDNPNFNSNPISDVTPYLDLMGLKTAENAVVVGVGVQLIVPITFHINRVLVDLTDFADKDMVDQIGFGHTHGNVFLGTCINSFPEYKKTLGQRPLNKFMEVSFSIFEPEKAFGLEIHVNFLRSELFWKEFHQIMKTELLKLNKTHDPFFESVIEQINLFLADRC
jgi:hypothetical protein